MLGEHYAHTTRTKALLHVCMLFHVKMQAREKKQKTKQQEKIPNLRILYYNTADVSSCIIWKSFMQRQHRTFVYSFFCNVTVYITRIKRLQFVVRRNLWRIFITRVLYTEGRQ